VTDTRTDKRTDLLKHRVRHPEHLTRDENIRLTLSVIQAVCALCSGADAVLSPPSVSGDLNIHTELSAWVIVWVVSHWAAPVCAKLRTRVAN